VLGRLANSSQVHYDYVSSVPIVSQSVVVSPFPASSHFSKSSAIASTYNTGSSQADQVFGKLPMKYQYIESVALIATNNTDTEPIEDTATPQIGNINSVEENLVNEPPSITEDHMFDKISHTTVSSNIHDMKAIVHDFEHSVSTIAKVYNNSLCKETKVPHVVLQDIEISNNDEEENSHENVVLFEKFPPLNTSDFSVVFACQGTVMSNANSLLAEIDYSYVVALWLHNWVDTGQECTLSEFLLSDICACKTFDVLDFSLGGVTWLAPIMRPQTGGCDQLNLSQFPFDPGAKRDTVSICLTATDLGVWNSRIRFTFMAQTGYTVNVEALQLQGCSVKICLIAYSNFMTRVWDPGQSWCVNSSILQSDLALVVALSPNFTHCYIVKRGISFYLTTWRRNIHVFLLA